MNMLAPGPIKPEMDAIEGARLHHPVVIMGTGGKKRGLSLALADFRETWGQARLVAALGLMDIKLRYRGSLIGPFWLTLSTAVMVGSIGFLYARLFRQDVAGYLPFLSVSLVLWNFISAITADGCQCFMQSEGMIKSMRMPLSLHAGRAVVRNIIVMAHNIIVIVVVFAIFHIVPSLAVWSLVPACAIWVADAFAVTILLGMFGARFRDIPPIVASIMQIAFYLTPVMWNPSMLLHRMSAVVFVQANPFYALLEIIRGPLLGNPLEPAVWGVATLSSVILWLLTLFVFVRARPRIAYWV